MRRIIELLIYMSLSGTACFGMYCLFEALAGDQLDAKSRYRFLKISLLFYLFPFPLMKNLIWNYFRSEFSDSFESTKILVQGNVNHLADGSYFFPIALRWQVVLIVWGVSLGISFFVQLYKGFRFRAVILKNLKEDEYHSALSMTLCAQLKINRKVRLLYSNSRISPCTFGWFYPIIIMTDIVPDELFDLALKHELYHIKHNDFLLRIGVLGARLLHCFNPIIYIFEKEFKMVQELYADSSVVESVPDIVRQNYGELLIKTAISRQDGLPEEGLSFSNACIKTLERRIKNLKNQKRIARWLLGVVIFVAVSASSVPIFAYTLPVNDLTADSDFTRKELQSVDWIEYSEGYQSPFVYDDEQWFGKMNSYIITDDGLVIPELAANDGENVIDAICHHQYVNATKRVHSKAGKGCTVTSYSLKRCKKCGAQKDVKRTSQTSYGVCPH